MSIPYRSMTKNSFGEDFRLQVARGQIEGHRVLNIFGFHSSIGTSFITPWELAGAGTQYVVPTSPTTMTVQSTSASDVNIGVLIQGLDSDYNEISEVILTNGTASVTTSNTYFRINKLIQVGGLAVGNISITDSGITYGQINAGVGTSQMAQWTIPAKHSFYIDRISGWSATANANKYLVFRNRSDVDGGAVTSYSTGQATFTNNFEVIRQTPFRIDQKTTLRFDAKSSSGSNEVSYAVEGILIQEEE